MRLLMLKRVLVASDLAGGSEPALRTAARLSSLSGAELHLLHVAPEGTRPQSALRLREQFSRAAPEGPKPASVRVVPGVPANEIVTHAVGMGADAVVLGPHRRGGEAVGELGSTAASVVRAATCPCLVAATELRLPLERVLVPVDVSEVTRGALAVALSWASALRPRQAHAELTALHVAPEDGAEAAPRELHSVVEAARERYGGAAKVEVREQITPGDDAADVILRNAGAGADLLVLGTRGFDNVEGGLGSVTTIVARATPCPLLLVPPEMSLDVPSKA